MKTLMIPILLAACTLAACGKAKPAEQTSADTAAQTEQPSLTVEVVTDIPSVTTAQTTPAPDSADEEYYDDEKPEAVSRKLRRSDADTSKKLVPDESDRGTGRVSYAYPMNSIILTLHDAPAEDAKVTAQLLSGTEVTVYTIFDFGFSDGWAYLESGGKSGWCRSPDLTTVKFEWLTFDDVELPETYYEHGDFSDGIYTVTAEGVKLKTAPNDSAETKGSIKQGSEIRAFGETESAEGWLFAAVSAEYLDEGGTGELYGWVDTGGGKSVKGKAARKEDY